MKFSETEKYNILGYEFDFIIIKFKNKDNSGIIVKAPVLNYNLCISCSPNYQEEIKEHFEIYLEYELKRRQLSSVDEFLELLKRK